MITTLDADQRTYRKKRRAWRTLQLAMFLTIPLLVSSPRTAGAGGLSGCVQDAVGFALNCTAEDVKIAKFHVLQVIDGCTGPSDTAKLAMSADLEIEQGVKRGTVVEVGQRVALRHRVGRPQLE